MIRFIHCADIHLGKNIRTHGEELHPHLQRATYTSFERIIDHAIAKEVDFVVISGDVYDTEQRPLKGQWFLKKQAERLQKKKISLYIIHGNHDPLEKNAMISQMPNNVYVFPEQVEVVKHMSKENDTVYLYGFSYPEKSFFKNPVPFFSRKNEDDAYHIALLHGQEASQKNHEPYAPFSFSDLKEKNFDYWALGHIHKRQVLCEAPMIVYPGNIQGAHRKEVGEKGAYFVQMSKGKTTLQFLPTAPIQWEKPTFSIDTLTTMDELFEKVEMYISQLEERQLYLFDLQVIGSGPLHEKLTDVEDQMELENVIQESILMKNMFIDRIRMMTTPYIDREKLIKQENILGDMVRIADHLKKEQKGNEILKPLFNHPLLRKYVTPYHEEELRELIDEAEKRLLTPLLSEVDKR